MELSIPDFVFNLAFEVDPGEGRVTLGCCLVFFSLYLTLDGLWDSRLMRAMSRYKNRSYEVALKIYNWTVWWRVWTPVYSWDERDYGWRSGYFILPDFFLGANKHSSKVIETRRVTIYVPQHSCGYQPMSYNAVVHITHDTWKRPRWPFTILVQRGVVDVPSGVPHPGKGTTSYNCGESRLYGLTTEAATVDDAVEKFVNQVNWYRNNYPL